jgi:hypothetical protein
VGERVGPAWAASARGRERGQRPELASQARKRKGRKGKRAEEVGRKGGKGEGRGEKVSFLKLFSNSFSNFQTSIKTETMHSNHDAQELIISNFI